MTAVYGDDVAAFVAANIPGCERGFGECQAIGFLENGQIVAGVVYHGWTPESGVIQMSAASLHRKWLTRERLAMIYEYPFAFCRMVMSRQAESNTRTRRIWRSLGANEYVIPQLRSPTEAEVIFTLTAEQWQASKFKRASHGIV